jgi:hypothetical protein
VSASAAISLRHVSVEREGRRVVYDLSAVVPRGRITRLRGPAAAASRAMRAAGTPALHSRIG